MKPLNHKIKLSFVSANIVQNRNFKKEKIKKKEKKKPKKGA